MSAAARRLLTVAAVAVALAAVVALSVAGTGGVDDGSPSSRSSGTAGTLALHDWLGDLGFDVRRLSGTLDLGGTDVLVLVEPTTTVSDEDAATILDFVERGGTLLLALDGAAVPEATPLLDRLGQSVDSAVPGGDAVAVQPLDPAGAVRHVAIGGRVLDLGTGGHGAGLLAIAGHTVLRGVAAGSGRAYVLGSPAPLTNTGLRATRPDATGALRPTGSDAALLALALIEHAAPPATPPLRIAFDEVHHGEGPAQGAAAILLTPLGAALGLAALAVLVHLATAGRRLGRPVPAGAAAAPPTATAYIGDVAALLGRSSRRGGIADRLATELRGALAEATGLDPHAPDAVLLEGLAGREDDLRRRVAGVLGEARRVAAAGDAAPAVLLHLAREVDAAVRRLRPGGAP